MSGNPCMIVEVSDANDWGAAFPPDRGAVQVFGLRPVAIPNERRPSVLQPNRQVAEEEAKRLAERHPGRRFMVFEARSAGVAVDVPSHTTVSGKVFLSRKMAVVVDLDDDEVPF